MLCRWVLCGSNGPPGVPGDLEDDERDGEADDRVADRCAERDDDGARDHAEGDVTVDAGVVPVRDQGRAFQTAAAAKADLGGYLVAQEADRAGGGEDPQVGEGVRVDQSFDGLKECDAG